MDHAELQRFGMSYAAAWCSQSAACVAEFYEEGGSLQINLGLPSVGRSSIAATAKSFMTAFPDMVVSMVDVSANQDRAIFQWTLAGTNTGPGGSGNAVQIGGYEIWQFGGTGLILRSRGHFDEADYQRQLNVK
ncbi:ester cyclase [Occallatibacter savannae]|uniref:ester cyclase n=1 Tax=Occallatibacter savannae TaxID=1002691 RepID=UPI000D68660B|nr:ester cyclase [Occallatibacter savannae]